MNYMSVVMSDVKVKNDILNKKIEGIRVSLKKNKIKITEKYKKVGNQVYYRNAIPYISNMRDVLTKPQVICKIRVNWTKKSFKGLTSKEILGNDMMKAQYGWIIDIVDSDHSRNNYKNKETVWVVFDTEEKAKKAMEVFNEMFLTAIEQDCIEEYKNFKKNPMKRPLTFDKVLGKEQAYPLYELVDKGEL